MPNQKVLLTLLLVLGVIMALAAARNGEFQVVLRKANVRVFNYFAPQSVFPSLPLRTIAMRV